MDKNDIAEQIAILWEPLSDEQRECLLDSVSIRRFEKNEVIYHENESPSHFMCLMEGKVKVCKEGNSGRQILRIVSEMGFFGYRPAIVGDCYHTWASAFEPSLVCMIPVDVARRLLHENNTLAMFFLKQLAAGLGEADTLVVNLTQKHIRGRLAESLMKLRDRYGLEADGSTLAISPSREDLANMSNMTTCNAIRTLSAFAADGIVAVDGRKIRIMSESGLREEAEQG